jgi:hypothetical protein
MAVVPRERLDACDGFRVESGPGLIGWVEETWLGTGDEPAALAVRTFDGRRGLVLADDVETVLEEDETVVVRPAARLLELAAPHLEPAGSQPLASWRTTGATLEPPTPPGRLRAVLLAHRAWHPAARPTAPEERPIWQIALVLYAGIAVLAGTFIAVAFAVAAALS